MRKKIKKTFRLISFLLSIIFLLLLLSSCSITLETSGENPEEAESIRKIEQIIASAKLQYPTKNSEFFYNVYDTHVTITKYIGDDGDVVVDVPVAEYLRTEVARDFFELMTAGDKLLYPGINELTILTV